MRRRTILKSVGGTTAGLAVLSGTASASDEDCGDQIIPGGPFPPGAPPQFFGDPVAEENYERFTENEELLDRLEKLDQQGRVEYEIIGESAGGRPVPYAKVGNGDYHVFHTTQQHGDEQPQTEALLRLLQRYTTGGGYDHILDEITIHGIPRHNPDGWAPADDNETPFRGNADGVDPNRQHDFEPGAEDNPSPETQAMIDKVNEVDADIVIDWHTQFTYRTDGCELVNVSLFWPIAEGVPQEAQDLSKQAVATLRDGAEDRATGTVSRFPGGTDPGICRNAYGLEGRGSVLVEQRGQAEWLYNASSGRIIRVAENMFNAIHEEAASGALFDRSPDEVDDLENFHGNFFWKGLPEGMSEEEAEEAWEEYTESH